MPKLVICIFGCLTLLFSPLLAPPQMNSHAFFTTMTPLADQSHVTVLVLDMSGSMSQNDPLGIRCSAAYAYIDLSGVGDSIGVIALDAPGNATQAQVVAQPADMATQQRRDQLKATIKAKTNNCRPDGATPTQDALQKAAVMLQNATQGGAISGSVILLTDGVPAPNTLGQKNAIQAQTLPEYVNQNWPIDVIALGKPGVQDGLDYHAFLSNLSDATRGKFYDDGNGVVAGVSPLNIAPFIADIFAARNGRTPGPTVPPTELANNSAARDVQVGQYVQHMDIIVVKNDASIQSVLTTPDGTPVTPGIAGAFVVADDPYYTIYSIDGPAPGDWTLSDSGSGMFLMDSLITSHLQVTFLSPDPTSAAALGDTLPVKVSVSLDGATITGGAFTVQGRVSYVGSQANSTPDRTFTFTETPPGSGVYVGQVAIPDDAPPGTYRITASVSAVSNAPLSSATDMVSLQRFPKPAFGANPTKAQVTEFDGVLRWIYSMPLVSWPLVNTFGGIALLTQPVKPTATFPVRVMLGSAPYCQAQLLATATRAGGDQPIPLHVTRDAGCGNFHVTFPPDAEGAYTITVATQGAFQDTHDNVKLTVLPAHITINAQPVWREAIAWIMTLLYLAVLMLGLNFGLRARPAGSWMEDAASGTGRRGDFANASRALSDTVLRRNHIRSEDAGLPAGLLLTFHWMGGKHITVDQVPGDRSWKNADGMSIRGNGAKLMYLGRGSDSVTYFLFADDPNTPPEVGRSPALVAAARTRQRAEERATDREERLREREKDRERMARDKERDRRK